MAQTPLEQLQTRLDAYTAAELLVLKGQSYQIKDRSLQRASLKDIREGIEGIFGKLGILKFGVLGRLSLRAMSLILTISRTSWN